MKNKITFLILLGLGALFTGCASSAKLNDIRIGMGKDQVLSIMGQPDSMSAQSNVEYLTYYLISDNSYGRDQPYMVRLVDGKVESFGRFLQLFDLYNRPVTNARPGDPNFPAGMGYGMGTTIMPSSQAAANDIAGQLTKLKRLKDEGVLTEDEFQKAKEKVLAEQK